MKGLEALYHERYHDEDVEATRPLWQLNLAHLESSVVIVYTS